MKWKVQKPENFELHNSLKFSFTKIQGLYSNFICCKSFIESSCLKSYLYVKLTRKTQLILAITLIEVIFLQFERILVFYLQMVLPFACDLSLLNSGESSVFD